MMNLVFLRLRLVAAGIMTVPLWQRIMFFILLLSSSATSAFFVPKIISVFSEFNGGLVMGSCALLAVSAGVFTVHLLAATSAGLSCAFSPDDPLDYLPVSAESAFYLQVLEDVCTEPVCLISITSLFLGLSFCSSNPSISLLYTVVLAPLTMAVLSAIRITARRIGKSFFSPFSRRVAVRASVIIVFILTLLAGACLFKDLSTLVHNTLSGLCPLDLYSSSFILSTLSFGVEHHRLLASLPLSWPVAAVLDDCCRFRYLLFSTFFYVLLLALLAKLNKWALARPAVENRRSPADAPTAETPSLLHWWLPLADKAIVQLECAAATDMGAASEALIQGVLLLSSMYCIMIMSPTLFLGDFLAAFRLFSALLTLMLAAPAAATARNSSGTSLFLSLPLHTEDILFGKLPFAVFRNIIVALPSTLCLPFILAPSGLLSHLAAATLTTVYCIVGALASVSSGMLMNRLDESNAGFAAQVTAMLLALAALAPLSIAALSVGFLTACVLVTAGAVFIFGLWQRALCRVVNLSLPVEKEKSSLADAAFAALLFILAGAAVVPLLSFALPFVARDTIALYTMLTLQTLVITAALFLLREKPSRLKLLKTLPPVAVGFLLGRAALVYAQYIGPVMPQAGSSQRDPVTLLVSASTQSPAHLLLLFLTAVLLGPLAEEIIFRRMIFRGVLEATSLPWFSILLSAFLFAGTHAAAAFPILMVLGVFTAIAYSQAETLTAPVLMHISFNLSQLLSLLWRFCL